MGARGLSHSRRAIAEVKNSLFQISAKVEKVMLKFIY